MSTKTTDELIWRRGNLYFGTAGTPATTPVGYISREGGCEITVSKDQEDYFVDDLKGAVIVETLKRQLSVKAKLAQVNAELLGLVIGLAPDGQVITIGGDDDEEQQVSFKIVGERRDGTAVTVAALYAVSASELALLFSTEKASETPLELRAIDSADGAGTITIGAGNTTATLASGVLTRTAAAGYHKVAGEGGAADVLDSITGASLTNGEILRLQIADVADPITLTHLADTLELAGEVDWIMASLNDYIDLQYDSGDTKWVEISRYDARA